jgi:universal stress protein A
MQTLKTILCATDFSELAANAFHAAHALARAHNARLILLYVRQPQETVEGEFGMPPPEPEPSDEEVLDRLGRMLAGSSIQGETLVVPGRPVEVIVEVAKQRKCDLIVLGSHGRRGLSRLLHGSVADSVTRHAPCPVMALRSSQTEADVSPTTP